MVIHTRHGGKRRGAAAVQAALVMLPLVIFMFGIYEYGRFLMDYNVLNNAAREGCRYAIVNNTSTTISTDVQTIVTNFMAGENNNFTGFSVTVSGTHNGTATAVNNLVAGDFVTVTVTGQYQFLNIIPLVRMPTALTVTSGVIMVCEGVT